MITFLKSVLLWRDWVIIWYVHWKADVTKTSPRGLIGPFFFENEQEETVTVNGDRYRAMLNEFMFTTFGFNKTALRTTQPKLYSMFRALFLKIALSATELMSFSLLGAAIWHRWTIICGVPSKISVTPTIQRHMML